MNRQDRKRRALEWLERREEERKQKRGFIERILDGEEPPPTRKQRKPAASGS